MRGLIRVEPRGWMRVARVVARGATGHHLDGQHRTDAGWFRKGVEAVDGNRHPSLWARLPRFHRAAWRWSGVGLLLVLGWGTWTDHVAMVTTGRALFWAVFIYGWYLTYRVCRKRGWYQGKYVPLARMLAPLVGWQRHVHPRDWLTIPLTYQTDPETPAVVRLPLEFRPTQAMQKRIVINAADRLALRSPDPDWRLGAEPPTLVLRCRPAPPDVVTYRDLLPLLGERRPGDILLGKAPADQPYVVALGDEVPHLALSAPPGAGKTICESVVTMQVLHDGGNALVLDYKRISLPWARDLEAVRYCVDVADIHDALVWLGGEVERRNRVIDATCDDDGNVDEGAVGAPLLVDVEEVNSLLPELVEHWRSLREPSDSKVSPAVAALRKALAMGRQGKIRVLGVAQYLTAPAIGGNAAKQNFSTRILLKPGPAVWNLLADPKCKVNGRWPESTGAAGRAFVLTPAGDAEQCQIALVAPREAKDYATNGVVRPFGGHVRHVSPGTDTRTAADTNVRQLRVAPARVLVSLQDACERGDVTRSFDAAEKYRTRHQDTFPVPQGAGKNGAALYDRAELRAFFGEPGREGEA